MPIPGEEKTIDGKKFTYSGYGVWEEDPTSTSLIDSSDNPIDSHTDAAGVLIANLDASKTVGTMEFGAPFSDGLTVVVASSPKMTVIYE